MSTAGHGMFSYIPDSSMIGTVFCNFIANAMCVCASSRSIFCNTLLMCVAYSCIDVQIQLENASFQTSASIHAAAPGQLSFAASGLQASTTCVVCVQLSVPCFTTLQYGQRRHFMFKLQPSASFSVRARAVVHGSSAVALTCVDPQPQFPLLTEQRALASYLQAIGKCNCHIFTVYNSLERTF